MTQVGTIAGGRTAPTASGTLSHTTPNTFTTPRFCRPAGTLDRRGPCTAGAQGGPAGDRVPAAFPSGYDGRRRRAGVRPNATPGRAAVLGRWGQHHPRRPSAGGR